MSWAIWITGLPGSGKSTLARSAAAELAATGERVAVLELDAGRRLLTPSPTYSAAERNLVYRSLVAVAAVLVDAGVPVVIDATAPRRAWRDLARARITRFAEVQLVCPLDVCRGREAVRTLGNVPPRIDGDAGRATATVPGADVLYEMALAPELVVDTVTEPPAPAARRLASLALELGSATPRRVSGRSGSWTIWISGPPGSGKTTLVSRVAEALTRRGVSVAVLDFEQFRDFVLGGAFSRPEQEDILHRALVYAAELLASAGVPVLIDAAGPRRRWRQLAREHLVRFGEVELVCPADVRRQRERVALWSPVHCGLGRTLRRQDRDLPGFEVVQHEPALKPELVIRTDQESEWSATERIRHLAERLLRLAVPRGGPRCLSTARHLTDESLSDPMNHAS